MSLVIQCLLFILLSIVPLYCPADIYKSTDSQGNVTYTDTPLNAQAEKIELPEDNQTAPGSNEPASAAKPAAGETTAAPVKEKQSYTQFSILSPVDQATIQNQPTVSIDITVAPKLQEGDKIQIYLDGRPWGAPAASTHFEFVRPDRGTHQIAAKLIDDQQRVLRETGSNTIFIHQAHTPTSAPVGNNAARL